MRFSPLFFGHRSKDACRPEGGHQSEGGCRPEDCTFCGICPAFLRCVFPYARIAGFIPHSFGRRSPSRKFCGTCPALLRPSESFAEFVPHQPHFRARQGTNPSKVETATCRGRAGRFSVRKVKRNAARNRALQPSHHPLPRRGMLLLRVQCLGTHAQSLYHPRDRLRGCLLPG